MKPHVRFALLLAAGLAGLTAALGLFFVANPIGISQWIAGGALGRMDLEKRTVETPRGPQTYYRGGTGARPVVLIHGLGNRAATWVNGVPTLMTRYPLVVIDLAGHGESAPEQGIITAEDLIRGVTTILDQASPDAPVVIVGHGLGGRIALRFALDHPDRVERLVLVNGGVPDGPAVDPVPADRDGTVELFRATSPDRTPLPAGFVLDDLRQKLQQSAVPRFVDGDAPDSPLVDMALERLAAPVDILWGTDDGLYPIDTARRLARELPQARLRELPGCGHLPHQQCTGVFLEALFEQLALDPPAGEPGDPEAGESPGGAGAPEGRPDS